MDIMVARMRYSATSMLSQSDQTLVCTCKLTEKQFDHISLQRFSAVADKSHLLAEELLEACLDTADIIPTSDDDGASWGNRRIIGNLDAA